MATIEQARAKMAEAGYSADQIAAGAAYAEEHGYRGAEEFFSLAMSRILYSDADLADGARYPVAPGSLDEPEAAPAAWRIEDKSNVHMNGKRTKFSFYRREGDAFVHAGHFTARGWDASDDACAAAALDCIDRANED